jgi:hypothetical protein
MFRSFRSRKGGDDVRGRGEGESETSIEEGRGIRGEHVHGEGHPGEPDGG